MEQGWVLFLSKCFFLTHGPCIGRHLFEISLLKTIKLMALLDLGKVRTTAKDSVKGTILCPEKWCLGKITSILACHAACFQFLFFFLDKYLYVYKYIYICTVYVYVSQNLSLTPTFFWVFHGNFLFQNLPKHNFSRIEWMIQKRAPQFQALEASWRCLVSMLLAQTPWRERSGPEPRFLVRQKFLVGPTNPAYLPGCLFGWCFFGDKFWYCSVTKSGNQMDD